MDNGLSSTVPEITSFVNCDSDEIDEEEEERIDSIKMHKQLDENLKTVFANLSDDDNEEEDEEDEEEDGVDEDDIEEDEDINGSYSRSQSHEEYSVQSSYEHPIQPNEPNHHSVLVSQHVSTTEGLSISNVLDTEASQHSGVNHFSEFSQHDRLEEQSAGFYNEVSHQEGNQSSIYNKSVTETEKLSIISEKEVSHHSDGYDNHRTTESHFNSENNPEYNPDNHNIHQLTLHSTNTLKNSDYYKISENSVNSVLNYSEKVEDNSVLYAKYNDQLENNNTLKAMNEAYVKDLAEFNKDNEKLKKEKKSLLLKLNSSEEESKRYLSKIQELETFNEDFKHENNTLKGKLNFLEIQLSTEREAKEKALADVERLSITVQSLAKENNDLKQTENVQRIRDQCDRRESDLKLRHQKEVLQLKEENDNLQRNLKAKDDELEAKISKFEISEVKKNEIINSLTKQLEVSQRQNQNLLGSGTIQENGVLQLKNQHLEQEKLKLEKTNYDLKLEIRSLKEELRTSEAVIKQLENENKPENKSVQSDQTDANSESQLQLSLKSMKILRNEKHSLEKKLEEIKHKLILSEESAKFYESGCKEYHSKALELEKKLQEVLPNGSIQVSQHEKEVNALRNELTISQRKLHDSTGKLKASWTTAKKLDKENKVLKNKITEMLRTHEKKENEIAEMLRKQFLESHEAALKKEKDKNKLKTDMELKKVHEDYNKKLKELKNEIQLLTKESDDAKSQYINVAEENKLLETKLNTISNAKGLEEIKRNFQQIYEKKLNEMEELNKYKYQSNLKRFQEDWVKQKTVEITEYKNKIEQQLDDRFHECVKETKQKLHSDFEVANKALLLEYQRKINDLKQLHDEEKKKIEAKCTESFHMQWKNKEEEFLQHHKNEVESMKKKYESQVLVLENEIKALKENQTLESDLKATKEKRYLEYQEKLKELNQQYESEKNNLKTQLTENHLKLKSKEKELRLCHKLELESVEEKYETKILTMENEIRSLKENISQKSDASREIEILKQEISRQNEVWNDEKTQLVKNGQQLEANLSSALEREKYLRGKIKAHEKRIDSHKKRCEKNIFHLQNETEELKKSIAEKESQILLMKEEYNQNINKMEENLQKVSPVKNSQCQTEDLFVSMKTLLSVQDMFKQFLMKIQDGIKEFLLNLRKCRNEQLHKALYFYHRHLISKLKDSCSLTNLYHPHMNVNFSSASSSQDNVIPSNIMQNQFNSNVKCTNSTPIVNLISGDAYKKLETQMNDITKVKTFHNASSTPDSALRFEDVSSDFAPINMHNNIYASTSSPEYYVARGLFNRQNISNVHPERLSTVKN